MIRPVGPLSELFAYFDETHSTQNSLCTMTFRGTPDMQAFERAVTQTQQDFPALISRIQERKSGLKHLLVRVPIDDPPKLEVVTDLADDLQGRTPMEAVSALFAPQTSHRIDLFAQAPARFYLVQLPENQWMLVLYFHHICSDGANMMGMFRTVFTNYHAIVTGRLPDWGQAEDITSSSQRAPRHFSVLRALVGMAREARSTTRHPVLRFGADVPIRSHAHYSVVRQLSRQQTRALIQVAKSKGMTVNDHLSISAIQSVDQMTGTPEGTHSFWIPANVRSRERNAGRRANYTTAINVDLIRSERLDEKRLARIFVERRNRLFAQGRDYVNLVLLRTLLGFAHLRPYAGRLPSMQKTLSKKKTIILSNVGVLWPERKDGKLTPDSTLKNAGGLEILRWDADVAPDPDVGHAMVAHTFHGRMQLTFSVFEQVLQKGDAERFMDLIVARLLA